MGVLEIVLLTMSLIGAVCSVSLGLSLKHEMDRCKELEGVVKDSIELHNLRDEKDARYHDRVNELKTSRDYFSKELDKAVELLERVNESNNKEEN